MFKIGIWGSGLVGNSVIYYLKKTYNNNIEIIVSDVNAQNNKESLDFIKKCDLIIPSPGVNINSYQEYKYKFIQELDLFYRACKSKLIIPKIIAVTGSVGKTSVVSLITQFLNYIGYKAASCGNIGQAALNFVFEEYDFLVLEASSFQLEHCKEFAPYISIFTNFSANHLDRHENLENYFLAKSKIFSNQTCDQFLIINKNINIAFNVKTFAKTIIFDESELVECPEISYKSNWAILFKLCEILNINKSLIFTKNDWVLPEHRLEFVGEFNGAKFYNDSKSTVVESTIKAVENFKNKNIILILGGISKGVDRSCIVNHLIDKVSVVICFGIEAEILSSYFENTNIDSYKFDTLDEAVNCAKKCATNSDVVLFSPSGASYDLFKDYAHRGSEFKKLLLS